MRRPLGLPADMVAAALLMGAATVLVATPYDGGACRNVAAAYALPAARVPAAEPPAPPAALADARRAVTTASSEIAGLADERAAASSAQAAAEQARNAAREARSATWSTPFPVTSSTSAELDVDFAESKVASAESWLQTVEEGAADTSVYGSIWTEQDVSQAQDELDTAQAELAAAEQALTAAQAEESAREAADAAVETKAADLETAAIAAERAASDAATTLAAAERDAEARLSAAESRVSELEVSHDVAHAEWWHEQRLEADAVVASNNVRASCRENGGWRAALALVDVTLLGALALRAWWPGTAGLRLFPRPLASWRGRLRR